MTYKDNTPTYNVGNRKVVNFNDFCDDCEKSKLDSIKRATKPNSPDEQQYIGNKRWKFNAATRKWDDLAPDMVDDKLDAIEIKEEVDHPIYKKYRPKPRAYSKEDPWGVYESISKIDYHLDMLSKQILWGRKEYNKELEVVANQIDELKSNFENIKDTYDTFDSNVLSR
jgi:hypothetical protein